MNTVTIKGEAYFPWQVRLAAPALAIIALIQAGQRPFLACVGIIIGFLVMTTWHYVSLDIEKKIYREGISLMWIKFGESKPFGAIEYLYVKDSIVTRRYNGKIQASMFTAREFNAYIRFSESEKVHILNSSTKKELLDNATRVADLLKVEVVDYTKDHSQ